VSTPRCCDRPSRTSLARRGLDVAGHVVPAAVLVLLPKCPACIVAWLAVGAGIGMTMSTAAYLRTLLLIACVACLGYVAARHVFRWMAMRRAS
jgi:hypothetical protein